jgi:hypothetical protein
VLPEAIVLLSTGVIFNLVVTAVETRQGLALHLAFRMLIPLSPDLAMAMLTIELQRIDNLCLELF